MVSLQPFANALRRGNSPSAISSELSKIAKETHNEQALERALRTCSVQIDSTGQPLEGDAFWVCTDKEFTKELGAPVRIKTQLSVEGPPT